MDLHTAASKMIEATPDRSDEVIAKELLRSVTKADLTPVVVEVVRSERRRMSLAAERAAFDSFFKAERCERKVSKPPKVAPRSEMRGEWGRLFGERFALGDGHTVDWASATAEQHRQRVEFLKRMRSGIDSTIERHETAIAALESSGAGCLRELEGAAVT